MGRTIKGQIGGQLRAAREAVGLTQAQLAERLGCRQTLISRYERDLKMPTVPQLCRIADALGVDFGYHGRAVVFTARK